MRKEKGQDGQKKENSTLCCSARACSVVGRHLTERDSLVKLTCIFEKALWERICLMMGFDLTMLLCPSMLSH